MDEIIEVMKQVLQKKSFSIKKLFNKKAFQ
jgi:hypothetical protein